MGNQYPVKRKHNNGIINRNNRNRLPATSPFSSNLANNMNFGSKGNDLSGYVKREVIMVDSQGNKQMAREVQFFNSWKNLGRVIINEPCKAKFKK